ncbi:prepilin peptidase [Nakamurella lactea]|uniref:prepilin peptidase n=1 Tax=Nakamurella lactea TaxID=459515 RepID=UPI0003F4B2DD|nr:prepilin peptidase [Nakamurella lactea]
MTLAGALTAGAAGLLLGASVGLGIRLLLARLRRGAVLPAGPVEAAAALVTAAAAVIGWGSPLLGLLCWLGLFGVAVSAVDLRHHRLPDVLTLPGALVTVGVVLITARTATAAGSVPRALLAAVVVAAVLAVPALLAPAAMGWGDVKLALALGAATGFVSWQILLIGVCLGFVLAAVVAVGGIAAGRWTAKSSIAFGPFLVAGAWLACLLAAAGRI